MREARLGPPGYRRLELDYPAVPGSCPAVPSHPRLAALVAARRRAYARTLRGFARFVPDLLRIEARDAGPLEPCWADGARAGLDAAVLYATVATERSRLHLEVGSGTPTRFARRAIADHLLPTRLVALDPAPGPEADLLCDAVVRDPLSGADPAVFAELRAGDVLFVSRLDPADAPALFCDVLPGLPPGVLVHLGGVLLPECPPADDPCSPQHLLAAWLLAGAGGARIELPNRFVAADAKLSALLGLLWHHPRTFGVDPTGSSFWLRTR